MSHSKMVLFAVDPTAPYWDSFQEYMHGMAFDDRYKECIGSYNGEEEQSFIMPLNLFNEYVRHSGYVDDQESFLTITGCNKAYAVLEYQDGRPNEGLGSMQQVSEAIARTYPSWTHRLDTNAWYICAHGNPDHSKDIGPCWEYSAQDHLSPKEPMQKHEQRVVDECVELAGKLDKLSVFLAGKLYYTLPAEDQELLALQCVHMRSYLDVLDCRIARFTTRST